MGSPESLYVYVRMRAVGLCGPLLTDMGLCWQLWASVVLCGQLWASVGKAIELVGYFSLLRRLYSLNN